MSLLIIFSSQHVLDTYLMLKSQTRLFINLSSIVGFSKSLCQGVACTAENWYASSHKQYFSKHRFLDICQGAFKQYIHDIRKLLIYQAKG